MSKRKEVTAGQIEETLKWLRRLTPEEYQTRRRWIKWITDPQFNSAEWDKLVVPTIAPGSVVLLYDSWEFTVDEVVSLPVDYSLPVETINKNFDMDSDYEYIVTPPAPKKKMVRAVLGCLNRSWREEEVAEFLQKPNSSLKGSGAWVLEAFLAARPRCEESWIGFPDSKTSRWRSRLNGAVYFPSLSYSSDDCDRELCWAAKKFVRDDWLCLIWGGPKKIML